MSDTDLPRPDLPAHLGVNNPAVREQIGKMMNDPEHAAKMQEKSRAAVAQNRKLRATEQLEHAADVFKNAATSLNLAALAELSEGDTTTGIARAADALTASYLAMCLSGDPQFVPQHGKEAMEMAKAVSSIARDYKARSQLDRLERDARGAGEEAAAADALAPKVTELLAMLKGRLQG
jgi:hypothetical protein